MSSPVSINHPDKHKPWWREPMVWLIAGLPALAVVAGITTVFIAVDNADGLVDEEHQTQGMTTTELKTPEDDKAARLGVSAQLAVSADGLVQVQLDGLSQAARPESLLMTVIHPTQADKDRTITLHRTANAGYQGMLPPEATGKRRYMIESNDHSWRLVGDSGAIGTAFTLAARTNPSTTHP